jgi:signal transduction histidine kinase
MKHDQDHNYLFAHHLMQQITKMSSNTFVSGLSYWQNEKSDHQINGDIVLNVVRPSGGAHVFIGEFIGQGLPVATAAYPVAEMFYSLTNSGYGLSDILSRINQKLVKILPEGFYCSATAMLLTQDNDVLAVWNGGLQDVLVLNQKRQIKQRIRSSDLPLGQKPSLTKTDLETTFVEIEAGDRIFAATNGLLTLKDSEQKSFSYSEVESALQLGCNLSDISKHLQDFDLNDAAYSDLTLFDWLVPEPDTLVFGEASTDVSISKPVKGSQWTSEFEFGTQTLKNVDIVPLLTDVVMGIQSIDAHRQRIYTILAEMYANALEHGVLKLDSSLKQDPHGFIKFYEERSRRLNQLESAKIKVILAHEPEPEGGVLSITVIDSGEGFDYLQREKNLADNQGFSGRGISLLRQLCKTFTYTGNGNSAHAEYYWHS